MEEQKRVEKLGPLLSKKDAEVIFVKPVLEPQERKSKSFMRAPSLDGHLHIPPGARRSPSPLGTYSMRIRNLREGSPASHKEEPTQVIRLRLRKQPSVDSGINLDVHTVKNMQKDIIQLSKYVLKLDWDITDWYLSILCLSGTIVASPSHRLDSRKQPAASVFREIPAGRG